MKTNNVLKGILILLILTFVLISGIRPAKVDQNGNMKYLSMGNLIDSFDEKTFGNPNHTVIEVEDDLVKKVTDENERARLIINEAKEERERFKNASNDKGYMKCVINVYKDSIEYVESCCVNIKYDITAQEITNAYVKIHSEKTGYDRNKYPSIVAEIDMFTLRLNFSQEINFMSKKDEMLFISGLIETIDNYIPEVQNIYLEVQGKYEYESNNYFFAYDEDLLER